MKKSIEEVIAGIILSIIFTALFLNVIMKYLESTFKLVLAQPPQELRLKHLGSGNFLASPEERTLFEYVNTNPFTIEGYINLKNMVDGDMVIIKEYVKIALDVDYSLYHEEVIEGAQRQTMLYIHRRPSMKGLKITIQQVKGEPKYFQWEFYGGFT